MTTLTNKIDFIAILEVMNANPNGDPLNGNRPRIDNDGYGEISTKCIKRKIRNRMQDKGEPIFYTMEDRCYDGFTCLKDRADAELKGEKNPDVYADRACQLWTDVRTFGGVFAFKKATKEEKGVSISVRGPVSVRWVKSVAPVDVLSYQITKSINGSPTNNPEDKARDRMGMNHMVRHGVYVLGGAVNVQLAEKWGFSEEDAELLKECIRTLFVNDASDARPDGSMRVVKLYWCKHNNQDGQYPSWKIQNSLQIALKDPDKEPTSLDDYIIAFNPPQDLEVEALDGD